MASAGAGHAATCGICEEAYTLEPASAHLPKHLPCGHVICADCLGKLRGEPRQCPFDRSALPAAVPTSFALVSVLESSLRAAGVSAAAPLCSFCAEDAASMSCTTCAKALCGVCGPAHPRMPATRGHVLTDGIAATATGHRASDSFRECHKHSGEEQRFYCISCTSLACRDCVAIDHRTDHHDVVGVDDAGDKVVTAMQQVAGAVKTRYQALEATQKAITTSLVATPAAIAAAATEARARIDADERRLMATWATAKKNLEQTQHSLATSLSELHAQSKALKRHKRDPVAALLAYQALAPLVDKVATSRSATVRTVHRRHGGGGHSADCTASYLKRVSQMILGFSPSRLGGSTGAGSATAAGSHAGLGPYMHGGLHGYGYGGYGYGGDAAGRSPYNDGPGTSGEGRADAMLGDFIVTGQVVSADGFSDYFEKLHDALSMKPGHF